MIPFTKAHACGNDFLIVADWVVEEHEREEVTRRLCARNTGIGADGIEYFQWLGPKAGRVRLHNADGSIAEISGNGTRCVAAWMAAEINAESGDTLEIETDAGLRVCRLNSVDPKDGFVVEISTGMGIPSVRPRTVRLASGVEIAGVEVSTGNPHFVIFTDDAEFAVAERPWTEMGAEIGAHADFPEQTNVEFVRVENREEIAIRIYERGVGATQSSGTGTSASAAAALALRGCVSPLTVRAPGGAQTVAWSGAGAELTLTGPAALIARGEAWRR